MSRSDIPLYAAAVLSVLVGASLLCGAVPDSVQNWDAISSMPLIAPGPSRPAGGGRVDGGPGPLPIGAAPAVAPVSSLDLMLAYDGGGEPARAADAATVPLPPRPPTSPSHHAHDVAKLPFEGVRRRASAERSAVAMILPSVGSGTASKNAGVRLFGAGRHAGRPSFAALAQDRSSPRQRPGRFLPWIFGSIGHVFSSAPHKRDV